MASIVCFASEALLLFTTVMVLILEGMDTGAGSITLRDIRLVELQEQQAIMIKEQAIRFFI
jgi:hypothetical protein